MVRFSEIQRFQDSLETQFPGNFHTIRLRFENFRISAQWKSLLFSKTLLDRYGVCFIINIPQSTDWLLKVRQQVRKPVLRAIARENRADLTDRGRPIPSAV